VIKGSTENDKLFTVATGGATYSAPNTIIPVVADSVTADTDTLGNIQLVADAFLYSAETSVHPAIFIQELIFKGYDASVSAVKCTGTFDTWSADDIKVFKNNFVPVSSYSTTFWGVDNADTINLVNAEYNWWGHDSGPASESAPGFASSGSDGLNNSGLVGVNNADFDPFYTNQDQTTDSALIATVFVDANEGLDTNTGANGSPVQTITKALLRVRQDGTGIIQLADGTYSNALTIGFGVTIDGNDGFNKPTEPPAIITGTVSITADNVSIADVEINNTFTIDSTSGDAAGNSSINYCAFGSNGSVDNNDAGTLNVADNFWGTVSWFGYENVDGIEDKVDGIVDYIQWQNEDFTHPFTSIPTDTYADVDQTAAVDGEDLGSGKYFGYNVFRTIQDAINNVAAN